MNIRKTSSLALAGTIIVASASLGLGGSGSAPAAQADPGFCGVRVAGPTYVGPPTKLVWAYTVRNTCERTIQFRVYLRTPGRYTLCSAIDPHGYHTYTIGSADTNWEVRVC
jgi:hypothetical protein